MHADLKEVLDEYEDFQTKQKEATGLLSYQHERLIEKSKKKVKIKAMPIEIGILRKRALKSVETMLHRNVV